MKRRRISLRFSNAAAGYARARRLIRKYGFLGAFERILGKRHDPV